MEEAPLVLVRASTGPLIAPTPERVVFPSNGARLLIGRQESADVQLRSSQGNGTVLISRQHAKMWYEPNKRGLIVMDLGSLNGIYVNCRRLEKNGEQALNIGDVVSFGIDTGDGRGEFRYEVRKNTTVAAPNRAAGERAVLETNTVEEELAIARKGLAQEQQLRREAEKQLEIERTEKKHLKAKLECAESVGSEKHRQTAENLAIFKDKLRERLECPVCLVSRAKSNMLLKCGHLVCGVCLKDWKKQANVCPTCREKLKEAPVRAYIVDDIVAMLDQQFGPATSSKPTAERIGNNTGSPKKSPSRGPMLRTASLESKSKRERLDPKLLHETVVDLT